MVHHPGRTHDPRVGRAGDRVASLLSAEQRGLLLCPADEQHPLGVPLGLEPGEVVMGDVVLALTPGEVDHRHARVATEPVDRGDKPLSDRVHQRRRGERRSPVPTEEPDRPVHMLQPGLVDVEIHPVDALDLQGDVVIEDISDAAGYRHHKLRS
jgi:hypothetical protein